MDPFPSSLIALCIGLDAYINDPYVTSTNPVKINKFIAIKAIKLRKSMEPRASINLYYITIPLMLKEDGE